MKNIISILTIALIFPVFSSGVYLFTGKIKIPGNNKELNEHNAFFNTGLRNGEIGSDIELVIDVELTRFEGRSLRPFVAIWIENEKGESVRTLALWFNNYKWLPDLRRWYSKNYEKTYQADYMDAITGATRPAGKYTIKWDGNDYQGNMQKTGKYTVYIEVVRERGTYQLIRQQIELNELPQRFELPSGSEISSATIEYRKINQVNTL